MYFSPCLRPFVHDNPLLAQSLVVSINLMAWNIMFHHLFKTINVTEFIIIKYLYFIIHKCTQLLPLFVSTRTTFLVSQFCVASLKSSRSFSEKRKNRRRYTCIHNTHAVASIYVCTYMVCMYVVLQATRWRFC